MTVQYFVLHGEWYRCDCCGHCCSPLSKNGKESSLDKRRVHKKTTIRTRKSHDRLL